MTCTSDSALQGPCSCYTHDRTLGISAWRWHMHMQSMYELGIIFPFPSGIDSLPSGTRISFQNILQLKRRVMANLSRIFFVSMNTSEFLLLQCSRLTAVSLRLSSKRNAFNKCVLCGCWPLPALPLCSCWTGVGPRQGCHEPPSSGCIPVDQGY